MRHIKETNTISELLNTFTFGDNSSKGKSLSDTIKQSTVFSFWEDIIGAKLAKYTKPIKIKYSKLYLSAKSPALVQELNLSKSKILKKINTYSMALGISIKDLVIDYKNYTENSEHEIPQDEKLNYYNEESFSDIEIDENYKSEIRNNIEKINFLSENQKEKLINKIYNAKKAFIKRNEDWTK
ncbi:MAG: DUF721 domain-containing protein [Candidatus Gastranaerophilales bacterium]|nr:DUF721 domain-containing protein [Candidatus Gastranaerophilales bacterium]